MTGQELSTVVRCGLNPIVLVLNNKGYTTERFIKDGPYNDIHDWAYHRWPELLRAGWGCEVRTEGDLETALSAARKNTGGFSILNVHLDPLDRSDALQRLARRLAASAGLRHGKRKPRRRR
jgi:indolepyruvate decarboxylase